MYLFWQRQYYCQPLGALAFDAMKLEIYHLYSLMLSRVFHWKKTQESTLEMAHSRTFSRRVCPNVAGSISSLLSCAAIMLLLYRQPVGAQDTSPAPVSIPDVKLLSVQFVIDKHAVSVFISNLKYRVWCIKNIMSEKVLWFYFSSFSLFYLYYYNYHLSYSPLFPFPSTTVSLSPPPPQQSAPPPSSISPSATTLLLNGLCQYELCCLFCLMVKHI